MAMRTQHGVLMSPRQERFWAFIRERNIPLCDWSTDEGVALCYPQLQAAEKDLAAKLASSPDDANRKNMLADLRAIMRRRPTDRVVATTGQREAAQSASRASAGEDDIARKIRGGRIY